MPNWAHCIWQYCYYDLVEGEKNSPVSKFAITLLILSCATYSYSQTYFGIKAGVNYNDITVRNAPFLPLSAYRPNIGFHVGVFTQIRISRFYFNPEVLFVQRGCNSSAYLTGSVQSPADTRINLNYIELPVLFTFFHFKSLSLEAGPNTSIKLSAKEISDNGKNDVSDRFIKPFDFGINCGIKAIIGPKILMTCRYYHGLVSVLQFPLTAPNTFPVSTSKTIQFSLHYLLRS
jgi:hypothetical protein